MFEQVDQLPPSLLDLLSTTVILDHVVAHLSLSSLFVLSATCKTLKKLVLHTPSVFRYLDLSRCRGAEIKHSEPLDPGGNIWRSQRMDESLTEDDFYSGPLRGIFSNLRRRKLLQDVQVLVLDGLSVTVELVNEIVTSNLYSVKLLSVVGCGNLNYGQLQQLLRYICRPERLEGTPKLKGIYVFPKKNVRPVNTTNQTISTSGILSVTGAKLGQDSDEIHERVPNDEAWWRGCGQVIDLPTKHGLRDGWEQTLNVCEGIIAFDGILCPNQRHFANDLPTELRPLATVSLSPIGCAVCGQYPQLRDGPLRWTHLPPIAFPLLSPLPHSGKLEFAAAPPDAITGSQGLVVSCEDCLQSRWCLECNRYWCHNCYSGSRVRPTKEAGDDLRATNGSSVESPGTIKVFNGLCIQHCLPKAEMNGAGAGGMWG